MENEEINEPLKILEGHEPMELFIRYRDANKTKVSILNSFYIYLLKRDKSRNTILSYMYHVGKLLKPLQKEKPVIYKKQIERFLLNKTVNAHASIKQFMMFCEEHFNQRFISINYLKPRKVEEKVIEVLTVKEIKKVINEMYKEFGFFTKFLYMTGCRISEPLRMKVESVNWGQISDDKEKYAHLKISHTKGRRERIVPLSPKFTKQLYIFLKREGRLLPGDFIFDFKIKKYLRRRMMKAKKLNIGYGLGLDDKRVIQHRRNWAFAKYIAAKSRLYQINFRDATIKALGKAYSPHILRRSRATKLLKSGVPLLAVRDFLGHKSIKTTEHYLTISVDELTQYLKQGGL